jgi:hypothetical protein
MHTTHSNILPAIFIVFTTKKVYITTTIISHAKILNTFGLINYIDTKATCRHLKY